MTAPTGDRRKMRVILATHGFWDLDPEAAVTLQNGVVKKAKDLRLKDIVLDGNDKPVQVVAYLLQDLHVLNVPPREGN